MSKYDDALNVKRRNEQIIYKLMTLRTDNAWASQGMSKRSWKDLVLDQDVHSEVAQTIDGWKVEIIDRTVARLQAGIRDANQAARDEAKDMLDRPDYGRGGM